MSGYSRSMVKQLNAWGWDGSAYVRVASVLVPSGAPELALSLALQKLAKAAGYWPVNVGVSWREVGERVQPDEVARWGWPSDGTPQVVKAAE